MIGVGVLPYLVGHEQMARHLAERRQQPLIRKAAGFQLCFNHPRALLVERHSRLTTNSGTRSGGTEGRPARAECDCGGYRMRCGPGQRPVSIGAWPDRKSVV